MKIAFVCHDADLTGAPKIGFELAKYLTEENEIIMVVKKGGHLLTFPEYRGVFSKVINSNTSHVVSDYSFSKRVGIEKKILKEIKPDLLYVNSVAASDWCKAGKRNKIPVVLHSHEMKNELLSLESIDILKKKLPRYVDLLITVSADAENDINEYFRIPFKKILSSTPGINFTKIEALANVSEFEAAENIFGEEIQLDKPVISMCGVASERKGSDIFIEAAKKLPQYNFMWVGPWNEYEASDNIAFEQYKRDQLSNFYITNQVNNPYPYFKMTDLFILTSREDPSPLVVMEAIFLSKLCIGFSQTGGSKYILDKYGILFNGEINVDRLIVAINKIRPDTLTDFLSEGKKKQFENEYDFSKIAKAIENEITLLVKKS